MNTLLVDMGNQRLKWQLVQLEAGWHPGNLVIVAEGAIDIACHDRGSGQPTSGDVNLPPTGPTRPAAFTQGLASGFSFINGPDEIFYSAVSATEVEQAFVDYCNQSFGVVPRRVPSSHSALGLENGYRDPMQLGSDRWLAALAGYHLVCLPRKQRALVVVDAGTAVTVDLVADGRFIGGAILPGINTIIRTLGSDTGQIQIEPKLLANDMTASTAVTEVGSPAVTSDAAVLTGAHCAVIGGVERCIGQMWQYLQSECTVLITGGDAALVNNGLKNPAERMANLVLSGLALVASEQRGLSV